MGITKTPAFDILPAYRPIAFELMLPIVNTETLENAVVKIKKDGATIATVIYKPSEVIPDGTVSGFDDYYFEVDIQKYVQDSLGPDREILKAVLYSNIAPTLQDDLYAAYSIEVTYQKVNAQGVLVDVVGSVDTSSSYAVLAASRGHLEQHDLEDYTDSSTLIKYLTKGPTSVNINRNEHHFISFAYDGAVSDLNGYYLEIFDTFGTTTNNGLGSTLAPSNFFSMCLNAGIDALSNTAIWLDGSPSFNISGVNSYRISFGTWSTPAEGGYLFDRKSEYYNFTIKEQCDKRSLRLFWLNQLSGMDNYTFKGIRTEDIQTKSERSQKALNWTIGNASPSQKEDGGMMKFKSQATESISITSKFLSNSEATWLKELLYSPKVYAQIGAEIVPVIIEDTEQVTNDPNGFIQYKFKVTFSNQPIIPIG